MSSQILEMRRSDDGKAIEVEISCSNCEQFSNYIYFDAEDLFELALDNRTIENSISVFYCSEACQLGRPLGA